MICGNCGAKLTCGCQKRKAANGKQCCSGCITSCNQQAGVPNSTTQTQQRRAQPKGPYTPHP